MKQIISLAIAFGAVWTSGADARDTPAPTNMRSDTTVLSGFKPVFAKGELQGCEYEFIVAHPDPPNIQLLSGYLLLMKPLPNHPETRLLALNLKVGSWARVGHPQTAWVTPAELGLQDGRRTNAGDIQDLRSADDGVSLEVAFKPGKDTTDILSEALIRGRLGGYYSEEKGGLSTTFSIQLDVADYDGSTQARQSEKLSDLRRCSVDIGYFILR